MTFRDIFLEAGRTIKIEHRRVEINASQQDSPFFLLFFCEGNKHVFKDETDSLQIMISSRERGITRSRCLTL